MRLSQEATKESRSYPGDPANVRRTDRVHLVRSGRAPPKKNLRPRIGVENRLPEFIEESLREEAVAVPAGTEGSAATHAGVARRNRWRIDSAASDSAKIASC